MRESQRTRTVSSDTRCEVEDACVARATRLTQAARAGVPPFASTRKGDAVRVPEQRAGAARAPTLRSDLPCPAWPPKALGPCSCTYMPGRPPPSMEAAHPSDSERKCEAFSVTSAPRLEIVFRVRSISAEQKWVNSRER